ncbi:MAG: DUF4956 domain-containing protein [Lachnospiraceae bacterium]|nr:DUF4956 domain-containing protein [Lachnospiraceae bacterium]
MLSTIFQSVFSSSTVSTISVTNFIICIVFSLVLGLLMSVACMFRSSVTRTFALTLAVLPAVVCVVIMMVNGNVGTGVAVAGAFSLVRFRSAPGTAKEITMLFLAMGAGLICGMGYLGFAVLYTIILCAAVMVYTVSGFGSSKHDMTRTLHITVPEDLNYTDSFNDLFEKYTVNSELVKVKTTNMGSLYKLTYDVTLRNSEAERDFIDDLRVRNGNLEIALARQESKTQNL